MSEDDIEAMRQAGWHLPGKYNPTERERKFWRKRQPEVNIFTDTNTHSFPSNALKPESPASVTAATLSKFPPAASIDRGRDPRE